MLTEVFHAADRWHARQRGRQAPPLAGILPGAAHCIGDRESIRRTRPRRGARPSGGDDDPAGAVAAALQELLFIAREFKPIVDRLVPLLATLAAQDPWVSQRETKIGERRHIRLAREKRAQGDPRAAQRGRLYLLRQSVIDDYLRGAPADRQLSPGEALLRELGELEAAE